MQTIFINLSMVCAECYTPVDLWWCEFVCIQGHGVIICLLLLQTNNNYGVTNKRSHEVQNVTKQKEVLYLQSVLQMMKIYNTGKQLFIM